ncbi:hypothetical protein [Candidatus Cyanaurora vandensis]|uniref:hypothetical protein n=1 Tax=Candidatus Cyanaurora vandensis TaxID=2714958 RepID=UPI0025811F66|nr:hypothetical protein [Candidatus Cyanaurora vandensis]
MPADTKKHEPMGENPTPDENEGVGQGALPPVSSPLPTEDVTYQDMAVTGQGVTAAGYSTLIGMDAFGGSSGPPVEGHQPDPEELVEQAPVKYHSDQEQYP